MSFYHILVFALSLASSQTIWAQGRLDGRSGAKMKNRLPSAEPMREINEPVSNDKIIDQTLLDDVHLHPETGSSNWRVAAGINAAWSVRKDYGARNFRRFEPEVVGYIYSALSRDRIWLRHGARLSYSDDQAQMPKSARLEETDWKASIEESLIWNWYVAPSLTVGVGYDWRTVKVKSAPPVKSADSRLNSKDSFSWTYAQAGIGFPALSGEYEFQPSIRWQQLSKDQRTTWGFGFEITKAW